MPEERALGVCLLWLHPFTENELKRRLDGRAFNLACIRSEPALITDFENRLRRDAGVYVVEADSARGATEAMVAGLSAWNPGCRILVMGEDFSEETAFNLLRLGTKGLLTYVQVQNQLGESLQAVAAGGFWVPRAVLSRFVESNLLPKTPVVAAPKPPVDLTPREHEVMEDLLLNLSNKEIAHKRHISSRTAKFHVSNVLAKHGVRRRSDLLLLMYQEQQREMGNGH